jgi:aminoglycoside phosphotransferase family enzyme/predicted kinase
VSVPATQQPVVAYLQSLAGAPPIETHISAVFVGQDTVWKLKKAIRLPFLDFSTPAAREHFLRRELELNEPAAPGIYRDVAFVGRKPNGTLALGEGEPVDWVLRMARVPAGDFLDEVAERRGLTPGLLDHLGDCVARNHARLPPVRGVAFAERMASIADGNAQSARQVGLPPDQVASWLHRIQALIEDLRPWLQQRSLDGFIRRCHGDLHLGNICLWDGAPVAFDALEFDEDMATIDTGYDLAFLLMDLDLRVDRAAANRVMNRYVGRAGDAGLVGGLPLYLSQRAMIRAHIMAATGKAEAGRGRLQAALDYTSPPLGGVVAIGGLQGTGKSTLARALAPELGAAPGALILRSDELRKRLWGKAPEERLPPEAYAPEANDRLNAALIEAAVTAGRSRHAVIVDCTFLHPPLARALEDALRQAGVPFTGLWLEAPLAVLEQRVAARRGDASDATVAVLREAAGRARAPEGWGRVDATDFERALAGCRRAVEHLLGSIGS